jgi:hypothetical protein
MPIWLWESNRARFQDMRSELPSSIVRLVFGCTIFLSVSGSRATEPEYPQDITRWQEIQVPPDGKNSDRAMWDSSANYSQLSWRVYLDGGRPRAKLIEGPNDNSTDQAPFDARADKFSGASRFKAVDDGWLVGFNHGEFGAALYWFDQNGKHHYKISNHQIVAFFTLSDGIYAIEGLAHMDISCGSVIHIVRPTTIGHWQAVRIVRLPFAPLTVAVRRDGVMLIVLTDSLVSVGVDHQVSTLVSEAPWEGLYPASSILLPDEDRLYIGMRQFVGEVDLATNNLRMLLPSKMFLNKLPDDQGEVVRRQYPTGRGTWQNRHPPPGICEEIEKAGRLNGR